MSHPRLPRTLGSVLWFPLAHYARHPFVLLATTALPLVPGQLLGAYVSLRRTEGARIVDGEVLVAPDPLGSRFSTTLGAVQLNPGWPADALTLVGWVIGPTAGTLVATAPLFGRYLPLRVVARVALRRLPLMLPWSVVVLGSAAFSVLTLGTAWLTVSAAVSGGSTQSLGMPFWPLVGLVALVAVAPLLLGLPLTVLHGTTLSEGIGAAWVLARGRRLAHLLCLMPLAALLLLPGAVEDRLSGALAGTGTGLALGVPLGVKVLLVLFLAPLPVLLLTGQALWTRRPPGGTEAASSLDQLSDGRLVLDTWTGGALPRRHRPAALWRPPLWPPPSSWFRWSPAPRSGPTPTAPRG